MISRFVFSIALSFMAFSAAAAGDGGLLKNPTFWLAVAFVIFIVFAFKPMKAALFSMLDSRIAEVEDALNEASRLKEEAVEMRAQAERAQYEAIEEAKRLIEYAQKDAELIFTQGEQALEKAIEKKKAALEQRIQMMEERTMAALRHQSAALSSQALTQLIDDNFSDEDDDALIADTIKKLPELMQQK